MDIGIGLPATIPGFDQQLDEMRAVWAQEPRGYAGPIGPAPVQPGGPPLLICGNVAATARRIVEFGAGWILGAGGPDAFAAGADRARRAWHEAGREGEPRLVGIAYASLGDDAEVHAQRYLGDYRCDGRLRGRGLRRTDPHALQSGPHAGLADRRGRRALTP